MLKRLEQYGLFSKAVAFTTIIHGVLIVLLSYNFNWVDEIQRGGVNPIQAVVVSERVLLEHAQRKAQKIAQAVAAQRATEERAAAAQRAKIAAERAIEKKRLAAEKKKKLEAERVLASARVAAEKKKKAAEKKRAEAAKKKLAAEKERAEEKKRAAARERAERLAQEKLVKTRNDAADALSALVDRIAAKVENNWRRPRTSQAGLTAIIRVKVARSGEVISATVTKSSGDTSFDYSAEVAVQKSSPLPFPPNPEYYEFINEFDFKFSPDES